MISLGGWTPWPGRTVAVTAERRSAAASRSSCSKRRNATVLLVPTVRAERVDDATLRSATASIIYSPLELWVASSAAAVQGWIATAWSWGLGPTLMRTLRGATALPRGASTAGALVGEGFDVDSQVSADTLAELVDHLAGRGIAGKRVAVLLHGSDMTWFAYVRRQLGAEVTEVPVYRLNAPGPRSRARPASPTPPPAAIRRHHVHAAGRRPGPGRPGWTAVFRPSRRRRCGVRLCRPDHRPGRPGPPDSRAWSPPNAARSGR